MSERQNPQNLEQTVKIQRSILDKQNILCWSIKLLLTQPQPIQSSHKIQPVIQSNVMGNQSHKPSYNPNADNQQPNNPNNNNSSKFEQYIKQAFRKASSNGQLTKDKFNQTLAVLEGLNFKRLRDTPLAERLFYLFDKNRVGAISEYEFSKGLSDIINDKNNAVIYSFRAYDTDGDNRISKREFCHFIEESWKAAFRILGQNVEKNRTAGLSMADVTTWSLNKISQLNDQTDRIFKGLDVQRTGFIEYSTFREWVTNSPFVSIKAELNGIEVEVPIHLCKIIK